jgi:hypothetical protein
MNDMIKRVQRKLKTILLIAIGAVVMTACKTTKTTESVPKPVVVKDNTPKIINVTAKLDVNVKTQSDDINVDGKLFMRYNEMIRITVVPYGIMEAARLEFTPNEVLLIDRINRQYVKAKYEDVPFLKKHNLNFQSLQQRFWDEYKRERISLDTGAAVLNIKLSKINNDATWDANITSVSSRYKAVSATELMNKFGGF